jgi:hypothetical protein
MKDVRCPNTCIYFSLIGDILTCKVMDDMGIAYPYSLAFDMRGQLWVGCCIKSNQIKSYTGGKQSGAKVHIVNLLC